MKVNNVKFASIWTDDCSGKQDLDFSVISVSTRYWRDFTSRPTIYLGDVVLFELEKNEYITGDSESDCKLKTEKWIKDKLLKITNKVMELSDIENS